MEQEFKKFLKNGWGLEIWLDEKRIFRSKKSGVKGLLDFIKNYENVSRGDKKRSRNFVIFDKIVGRGAALLIAYLKVKNYENVSRHYEKRSRSLEVYGVVGSKLAAKVLRKYKIKFYFHETIPKILNIKKTGLCPIEKFSIGKTPEEFYPRFKK